MKIALISYWTCPLLRVGVLSAGGMSIYILNLANNLGKKGFEVDIYTRAHDENDQNILKIYKNVNIIHFSQTKKDIYEDIENFSDKVSDYIANNNIKYSLIHSHYYYSGLVGLNLRKRLNIPLFMTFHALGKLKEKFVGIRDFQREESEEKIVKEADAIIASTELEKDFLRKSYGGASRNIFVVPPGVDHHLFKKYPKIQSRNKLHLPQNKKIILFVGRIDPIKGLSLLIESIYKLTKTYPNFENNYQVLLIGGDIKSSIFWQNSEVIKIKSLIKKRNLECCVKFIGSRPHKALPLYYSASDLVVMPSFYESFGLVVIEAMACASAVVASKAGGLKYLIDDKINGRLFESGNVSQLSEIIWELINNISERNKYGRNAVLTSQNYCWEKQANKIIDIYKSVR